KQRTWHSSHNSHAIPARAIGGSRTAMRKPRQRSQRLLQYVVRGRCIHRGDKPYPARIVIEALIEERRSTRRIQRKCERPCHASLYVGRITMSSPDAPSFLETHRTGMRGYV